MTTPDDATMFARLRQLFSDRDPVPPDLADSVLVNLATRNLAIEYAMLTMLAGTGQSVGVRAEVGARILEFTGGDRSVMLRVSELPGGKRRIDGWIAPSAALLVRLEQGDDDWTTAASAEGRFEFTGIPSAPARLWLQPDVADTTQPRRGFTTPSFDL